MWIHPRLFHKKFQKMKEFAVLILMTHSNLEIGQSVQNCMAYLITPIIKRKTSKSDKSLSFGINWKIENLNWGRSHSSSHSSTFNFLQSTTLCNKYIQYHTKNDTFHESAWKSGWLIVRLKMYDYCCQSHNVNWRCFFVVWDAALALQWSVCTIARNNLWKINFGNFFVSFFSFGFSLFVSSKIATTAFLWIFIVLLQEKEKFSACVAWYSHHHFIRQTFSFILDMMSTWVLDSMELLLLLLHCVAVKFVCVCVQTSNRNTLCNNLWWIDKWWWIKCKILASQPNIA